MNKSILVAFVMLITSFSAYAWTENSQRQENFGGLHKVYHLITCNSGNKTVLVYQRSMVLGDYHIDNTQKYFKVKSLDAVAKIVCGE